MKMFKADLHIHTCLSPCAELEMSPRNIVRQAKECGLDIIGICDHNSCENVEAVRKASEKEGIGFIGGVEVTTREEVHILAFFTGDEGLSSIQRIIYDNLPGVNDERLYGEQVIVDEKDEVIDFNKRLLIGATQLSVDNIVDVIHGLGGLAIAAHVDREGFGIIGQLGFIPEGLKLDALEVFSGEWRYPGKIGIPLIASSDAHYISNIGSRFTQFFMEEATFDEIKKTILGEGRRKVIV